MHQTDVDVVAAARRGDRDACGGSNPDLQSRAIQYLGVHGSRDNRQVLAEIYGGATDVAVKRQILRAFMVAGDRERVLAAAAEKTPELRTEAVRLLGAMGGRDELWALYQKETSVDVKKQILQAMFVGGDATRMIEVANTEANPDLRRHVLARPVERHPRAEVLRRDPAPVGRNFSSASFHSNHSPISRHPTARGMK